MELSNKERWRVEEEGGKKGRSKEREDFERGQSYALNS